MSSSLSSSASSISMLGFIPAIVVQYLMKLSDNKYKRQLPEKQALRSVVMFADISGFTNLTETLSKIGPEGAEVIAFAINRYMELLVKGIGRSGGDIFKFAGDAMIVVWPPPPSKENGLPSDKDLETLCKQAIQSAIDIQAKLNDTNILENIKLSVKIGFGIGDINIIHVGGVFQRTEYLATGDPLIQAFESEHCCLRGGQTIVSEQVYEMVSNFFDFKQIIQEGDGHGHHGAHYEVIQPKQSYLKVKMKADALMIKNTINLSKFEAIKASIQSYIPAALIPFIEIDEESWSSELRRLTVMFVNLGIDLSDARTDSGLNQIQKVIQTVQKSVYMHEGSLNKLLMDDKGSTLIVVFGLPPMAHQDDAIRAILTGFSLQRELKKIKCSCSIGISTGTVFAGVVGTSGSRREYSVLGDSVNLAARLMQTACGETERKIIICQQTSMDAEHKLLSIYYKSVKLKGKLHDIAIYYPIENNIDELRISNEFNYFPELKTHRYNLLPFEKSSGLEYQQQLKQKQLFMIGKDEIHKRVQNLLDKFMKGVEKKCFIIMRGSFGVGKTLLLRKILSRLHEKINSNQYNIWKYGEKSKILIQCVDPINKNQKLCGLKNILQGFFLIYAQRLSTKPDITLLNRMVEKNDQNADAYELLLETLELKKVDVMDNFPPKPDLNEKKFSKQLKLLVFKDLFHYIIKVTEFLSNYFEEVPESMNKKRKKYYNSKKDDDLTRGSVRIQVGNVIAPILLCFDDMQNYDELSFKIIKNVLLKVKEFDRIMVVGLIRDSFLDFSYFKKGGKTQEEIFIENIQNIENVLDQNQIHSFILRGLQRLDKEDEFLKLLRITFNISQFSVIQSKSNRNIQHLQNLSKQQGSSIDVQQQDQKKQLVNNYYLFQENKSQLFQKDIPLLLLHFIYLKTSGNPHMTINLVRSLIQQNLLTIDEGGKATIHPELIYILDNEEMLVVDAPLCRVQVNGPIIDRLSCLESLLMKAASVIGEIFDIQTLNRIQPLKTAINQERLIFLLNDLQNKDLIEIMNISEYNTYYRFTYPFMRECLYQRMTYKQRRQIHLNVAEAIQFLPSIYETEELMENKKLEFHWTMAEQKWSLDEKKKEPETAIEVLDMGIKTMSHKALRSIIVKQIQNKLAKSNNDPSTIIKEGYLDKKSGKNYTWAMRYCVMDGKEFKYYYGFKESQGTYSTHLCSFLLKNIYAIIPLNEGEKDNKKYAFYLSVSSWYKLSKEKSERKFYFAAQDEQTLEQWTIFLEFARAKAIYDEFVNSFGKIQFPIGSQIDIFDMAFKNDIYMRKRYQFTNPNPNIQNQEQKQNSSKNSIVVRNSRSSKFMQHRQQMKYLQRDDEDQKNQQFTHNVQDLGYLKERISVFLKKSTLSFYSHIFDMAIQRQDEYKTYGQSNYAMRKMPNIFKIERKLCQPDQKGSLLRSGSLASDSYLNNSQTKDNQVEKNKRRKTVEARSDTVQLNQQLSPKNFNVNLSSPEQAKRQKLLEDIEEDLEREQELDQEFNDEIENEDNQANLEDQEDVDEEQFEDKVIVGQILQKDRNPYISASSFNQKNTHEIKQDFQQNQFDLQSKTQAIAFFRPSQIQARKSETTSEGSFKTSQFQLRNSLREVNEQENNQEQNRLHPPVKSDTVKTLESDSVSVKHLKPKGSPSMQPDLFEIQILEPLDLFNKNALSPIEKRLAQIDEKSQLSIDLLNQQYDKQYFNDMSIQVENEDPPKGQYQNVEYQPQHIRNQPQQQQWDHKQNVQEDSSSTKKYKDQKKVQNQSIQTQTIPSEINFIQTQSQLYAVPQPHMFNYPQPPNYQQILTQSGLNYPQQQFVIQVPTQDHYGLSPEQQRMHFSNSPLQKSQTIPVHLQQPLYPQYLQVPHQGQHQLSNQSSVNHMQYQYNNQYNEQQSPPQIQPHQQTEELLHSVNKSREKLRQSSRSKSKSPLNSSRSGNGKGMDQSHRSRANEKKGKTKSSGKKKSYFGIIKRTCSSIRGDIFTLDVGQKILITKLYRERGFAECSVGGRNGIFKLEDIQIQDDRQKLKPLDEEISQKEMVSQTFNLHQSNLLNFHRSTTPQNK